MALDVRRFRILLRQEYDALVVEDQVAAEERAPVELDQESVGRLSRIDAMQVQAMALAQASRRRARRAMINAALERLNSAEFGYCLRCGEEIALARLENDPVVATCIECAQKG